MAVSRVCAGVLAGGIVMLVSQGSPLTPGAIAAGSSERFAGAVPSTVISANGEIFTAHEQSRGRVRVPTPGTFTRLSVNGARTARYRVAVSATCDATLVAAVRGVTTADSLKRQIQRALGHGTSDLAAGTAAAGPWRMTAEGTQADEHRALYGILPVRVANHRYAQLRLLGNTNGACTDAQVHSKAFATALTRYFSGARFEITVQRT